jgi:selenocysteine-specific elongation factor
LRNNPQKIIGLAGHIDHGKTAIVKILTGVDTDKLKEEKARGVTIDIGFAFYNDEVTFIDVPGHEKFVKNMVTGVSTVHMALLVIAADDGVMPQTREHLEILSLLGIKKLIVVLNKIDLVDAEWVEMIQGDIKEFITQYGYNDVPIIPISAKNLIGISELKNILDQHINDLKPELSHGMYRQSIDRVFSIKGFGTVVTGTILSQDLRVGQKVCLYPQNIELTVRGIQSHNKDVEKANAGDRAAVNLNNISVNELRRGNFIAAPNCFETGPFWLAKIHILSDWKKSIKDAAMVQVHLGTGKMQASLHLLEHRDIKAGESQFVQIKFKNAMSAARGDKFVLRAMSPELTFGGGEILWITASHIRRGSKNIDVLKNYDAEKVLESAIILVRFSNRPLSRQDFVKKLNLNHSKVDVLLRNNAFIKHTDEYFLYDSYQSISKIILETLQAQHEQNPGKNGFTLAKTPNISHEALTFALAKLLHDKAIIKEKELYILSGYQATLNADLSKQYAILKNEILEGGYQFVGWSAMVEKDASNNEILSWMMRNGELIHIENDFYLLQNQIDTLLIMLREFFKTNNCMTMDDAKTLIQSSRKYLIPLLNYLERKSWIMRDGDCRRWVGELER